MHLCGPISISGPGAYFRLMLRLRSVEPSACSSRDDRFVEIQVRHHGAAARIQVFVLARQAPGSWSIRRSGTGGSRCPASPGPRARHASAAAMRCLAVSMRLQRVAHLGLDRLLGARLLEFQPPLGDHALRQGCFRRPVAQVEVELKPDLHALVAPAEHVGKRRAVAADQDIGQAAETRRGQRRQPGQRRELVQPLRGERLRGAEGILGCADACRRARRSSRRPTRLTCGLVWSALRRF